MWHCLCFHSSETHFMPPRHNKNAPYPATRSSLIARVRDPNDVHGWREFHEQYQRIVMHVCLKTGLNQQDAEDVTQDTMVATAQALPGFQLDRTKGSFRNWLFQITYHKVNDFLRKKYREGKVRTDIPEGDVDLMADDTDRFGQLWNHEWREYLLEQALDIVKEKVSARSFQIFHLSAVMQWSVEQIKTSLGLSVTTVYLARYRVGALVNKELEKLQKEWE